jgi:cytochrome oxidase assembly protein ShyY1
MGVRYGFLFRPRWIAFHLLVIATIVAMINLGFWQLRRLDERREFNEQVSSRIDLPPAPLDEVVTSTTDPDAVEWRSVEASGTYLPDEQFVVVNRSQSGRPGDLVVTPLVLDDGRILLVERGFVPLDTDSAAAPSGHVEIVGRLRPSQERRRGQLSDPAEGDLTQVQRVDIDRMAGQLPGSVVPMYVELVSSTPAETGPFPEPIEVPELDEGPHLSYAVQWFIFTVCVAVGWVLAVRHSIRSRTTARTAPPGPASLER